MNTIREAVAMRPRQSGYLDAGAGHRIHFEQWGASDAVPVAYLHGGPGSGCGAAVHSQFDLERFAPVLHDQRGAGRSVPGGSLHENTTERLLQDLERLRVHLGIDRWILFGGSWGAALALLYAQRFPERVLGMVLRGVFLARPRDARWFFGPGGVARIYPREYAALTADLSETERQDMPTAFAVRLHHQDPAVRVEAARRWRRWEDTVVRHGLPPEDAGRAAPPVPEVLVQRARIATHYACNGFFLGESGVLKACERLQEIPGQIVHGALDLVCPVENAWTLHRQWPRARLRVVDNAGHAAGHPAIRQALAEALDEVAGQC